MISIAIKKVLNAASGKIILDLDLSIPQGQFLALYGKSGVGKTSILRILAGLMKADEAFIEVERQVWIDSQKDIFLKPQKRSVGMVFQDYALFPNMSVEGNLRFALKPNMDKGIVEDLIQIMELEGLRKHKPDLLSGGQKQRVALARALVQRPKLLLLDEPLSALDAEMRTKLQDYILRVHHEFKLTTILVSHNKEEVLKMAEHLVWLDEGRILQKGSPREVLSPGKEYENIQIKAKVIKIDQKGVHVKINDKIIILPPTLFPSQAISVDDEISLDLSVNDWRTL